MMCNSNTIPLHQSKLCYVGEAVLACSVDGRYSVGFNTQVSDAALFNIVCLYIFLTNLIRKGWKVQSNPFLQVMLM